MNQVRWLCVGTGDIVRKRAAAALAKAEGGELVGICGGIERAQSLAAEHRIPEVYDDLDQALRKTAANAVYIGTAVHRHREQALRAVAAGKHVLIEKPLGLDAPDANAMVQAVRRAGVIGGCAYYRRTFPRYVQLKQMVDQGALGRIVLLRLVNCSWYSPQPDHPKFWRVQKEYSGGGPLADVGVHMFDLLIGLFGLPRTVFARCDTLVQNYQVEDSATMVMTLRNGAHVSGTFGWNTKAASYEMEVVGSEAKVLWRPADTGPVLVTRGQQQQEVDAPNHANLHQPLVTDFNAAIIHKRQPVCPLEEAAKTNRLLDGIYASSAGGNMVELA